MADSLSRKRDRKVLVSTRAREWHETRAAPSEAVGGGANTGTEGQRRRHLENWQEARRRALALCSGFSSRSHGNLDPKFGLSLAEFDEGARRRAGPSYSGFERNVSCR
jgi:hypothetical protein